MPPSRRLLVAALLVVALRAAVGDASRDGDIRASWGVCAND